MHPIPYPLEVSWSHGKVSVHGSKLLTSKRANSRGIGWWDSRMDYGLPCRGKRGVLAAQSNTLSQDRLFAVVYGLRTHPVSRCSGLGSVRSQPFWENVGGTPQWIIGDCEVGFPSSGDEDSLWASWSTHLLDGVRLKYRLASGTKNSLLRLRQIVHVLPGKHKLMGKRHDLLARANFVKRFTTRDICLVTSRSRAPIITGRAIFWHLVRSFPNQASSPLK